MTNKYIITDSKIYSNDVSMFSGKLEEVLKKHNPKFICFRDKISPNIEELAKVFLKIGKNYNIPHIVINSHIDLAYKLNFKTIHLNSSQLNKIYTLKKDFKIIASTHNDNEIIQASKADYITYSPIFKTPNKDEPKGIEELKRVVQKFPKQKIFALGGIISQKEINICKETNCFGIASIRLAL